MTQTMFTVIAMAAMVMTAQAAVPRSAEAGLSHASQVRTMPYVDNNEMIAKFDEMASNRTSNPGPFRFGIEMPLNNLDILSEGAADEVDDGTVYRWRVDSKGAVLMQIAFSMVELQGGSMMYIYQYPEEDGAHPLESAVYSNDTHHMGEPRDSRMAVSPFIPAESTVVEVFVPTGGFASVKVHHVLHAFRDVLNLRANSQKVFGDSPSQPCENNAKCFPEYSNERRAVSLITAGGGLCTGFMVNNVEGSRRTYMTASHCLESGGGFISDNTLNFADFYFNAESFSCGNNNGPSTFSLQKLDGSSLLGNVPFNGGIDYAVLRLDQNPPNSFNLHYLGWESSNSACCGGTVGIHHPGGDYMKVSIDNQQPTTGGFGGAFNQWEVRWNDGITAGGSSGSPLIRQSTRRVLGQLRGGSSFCNTQSSPDWYGKVSLGYNQGLDDILASGTSVTSMDGSDVPGSDLPPSPPPSPPPPSPPTPPPPAPPEVFFFFGDQQLASGGGVSLPILIANFQKVAGVQFSVQGATIESVASSDSAFTTSFNPLNGVVIFFSLSGSFFPEISLSAPPQDLLTLTFGSEAIGSVVTIVDVVISDNAAQNVPSGFVADMNSVLLALQTCGSGVSGDATGDSEVNILDVIFLLNVIVGAAPFDPPCLEVALDLNDDGTVNISDVLVLVDLFTN